MGKAHPIELRERVLAFVEEGHSHRATARLFRVSVKFVNDMVKLKRETGSLAPKPLVGTKGRGKLAPYMKWLQARMEAKGEITLHELKRELKQEFGLVVHHSSICRALHRLNLSHKKRRSMPKNNTVVMSVQSGLSGSTGVPLN